VRPARRETGYRRTAEKRHELATLHVLASVEDQHPTTSIVPLWETGQRNSRFGTQSGQRAGANKLAWKMTLPPSDRHEMTGRDLMTSVGRGIPPSTKRHCGRLDFSDKHCGRTSTGLDIKAPDWNEQGRRAPTTLNLEALASRGPWCARPGGRRDGTAHGGPAGTANRYPADYPSSFHGQLDSPIFSNKCLI
jgi:hypothetical protein